LACTGAAGWRKEKVNSSGLGWAGLLGRRRERRCGGELGREREKGRRPKLNSELSPFPEIYRV
jgi:hypothetical protein